MIFQNINSVRPSILITLDKKICEKCKKEYFQYSLDTVKCDCDKNKKPN